MNSGKWFIVNQEKEYYSSPLHKHFNALENLCAALQQVRSSSHNTDEVESMEGPGEFNAITVTFADPEGLGAGDPDPLLPNPLKNHKSIEFLNNIGLDL